MNRPILLAVLATPLGLVVAVEGEGLMEDGFRTSLEVQEGVKFLDRRWAKADVQNVLALNYETRGLESFVGFCGRISYSFPLDNEDADGRGEYDIGLTEGDFGVNLYFLDSPSQEFFVGAGLALVDERAELRRRNGVTNEEHGTGVGGFGQVGYRYIFSETWSLSLTASYTYAAVDSPTIFAKDDVNVGGAMVLLGIGGRF